MVAVAMPSHVFAGREGTRLKEVAKKDWMEIMYLAEGICDVVHVKI